jgi:hypothetical protein
LDNFIKINNRGIGTSLLKMSYSPELCLEALKCCKEEFSWKPRACEIIDRAIVSLRDGKVDSYEIFKECMKRVREIVGQEILQHVLNKPKDDYKRDMRLFLYGTPHRARCTDRFCAERECVVHREVEAHLQMKTPCTTPACSTCRLMGDLQKFYKKRTILNARYGIGDRSLVDFVSHVRNCRDGRCSVTCLGYGCLKTKQYFAHEKVCCDANCTCSFIEPLLRFVDREGDDLTQEAPSVDQIFDIVYQSGIDEEEMRLESISFNPGFCPEVRKRAVKTEVISPELRYVWSFGVDGSID